MPAAARQGPETPGRRGGVAVALDRQARVDDDKTAFAHVKDFYVPKPPLEPREGEKAKRPGATITPREWQELLEEVGADELSPRAGQEGASGQGTVEILVRGACRCDARRPLWPCACACVDGRVRVRALSSVGAARVLGALGAVVPA